MSDLGFLHFYLGIEFLVSKDRLILTQHAYILSILKEFRMNDVNPISIPLLEGLKLGCELNVKLFNASVYFRLVGKLIYLLNSRLDLLFVRVLSMYVHDPMEPHWQVAKHVLWYFKGTINFGITYGQHENTTIVDYTYANRGNNQDDYKSITSYVFKSICGPITWALKNKKIISLSSTNVETKTIVKVGPIT